ncbi:hypothetical protein D3C77_245940 [compost metagenome]
MAFGERADTAQQFIQGGRGVERGIVVEVGAAQLKVHVGVLQAGQQQPPLSVDSAGFDARHAFDIDVGTHSDDAPLMYGDGLGPGQVQVHGVDVCVGDDQVC